MRKEPDIVRELREAEKLGLLHSKAESVYETPEIMRSFSQNVSRQDVTFVDDDIGVSDRWGADNFYQNIVEQAIVGVVVSRNGRVVFCNKRESEIFGYEKPSDLYGKSVSDLVHKDDVSWLIKFAEELRDGKASPHLVTFRGIHADGKEIYVEGYAIPLLSHGKSTAFLSFHIDATEHKKDEVRFREQERRYRLIAENTSDLIAVTTFSLNPKYTYVSPSHERVMGYNPEELIGKSAFDLIHPKDRKKLKQIAKKYVVSKGKKIFTGKDEPVTENLEFRIKDKSGKWRYLESTADVVGNEFLFVSRDITERKKTEEKIRNAEEDWRNSFNSLEDSMLIIDREYNIENINKNGLKLLGKSREEVIGKKCYQLFHGTEKPHEHCPFKTVLKTKKSSSTEQCEDTLGRYFSIKSSPIFDESGEIIKFVDLIRDITEQKKAEKKFRILFETSRDSIMTLEPPSWKFTSGNKATIELFNAKDEEEFTSKGPWDLSPERQPDGQLSSEKAKKMIEKAMNEGSAFFEWTHKTMDGKEFSTTVLLTRVEIEKGKPFLQATVRDITGQKKMREWYRILFNYSPDAIMLLSEDKEILSVNPSMARSLGVSADDLIGRNICDILPKDVDGKRTAIARKALETGEIQENEDERNGRFFHNIFVPIFTTDGNRNIQVISRDITVVKKSEMLLKESEEKFRIISSAAYDAIIMMDNDGNINYWNKAAEKMFGYNSKEVIGKNLHMVLTPEDFYTASKEGFEKFRNTGKGAAVGRTIELPALRKDGTEIMVDLSLSSVKIKGKWNAIGIVRDITKRKEIEKEIQLRDEAIKSAINGIAITDSLGNVIYVNDSFLKMWRYNQSEQVIGKPIVNFWKINENYRKIMNKLIDIGGWTGELIGKRGDGSTFPVQLSINFVKDETGKISNIFASFVDITEQKRAEEEIKRKQEKIERQNIQLRKLDKIKSNFLNITSHELRTPMSAIKGYAQMISKEALGKTTDEQQKALNVILRNIDRLDNLIRDILDVSRLESGTMKFLPEQTDIKEMISQVTETMQSFAETKKIQIKTTIQDDLPKLFVDPERIKQVIINITNNAIKFSPENSTVHVRVKKDKKDKILFEIQDFGKGIPKNKQKKIFDTFYQVDSGMDRKFGGAGLGLAISRGIILSHGGKIWVDSKVGEGSTFKFTLPIKPVVNHEERFKEANIFGLESVEEDVEK